MGRLIQEGILPSHVCERLKNTFTFFYEKSNFTIHYPYGLHYNFRTG